jgi:hypothetical protein
LLIITDQPDTRPAVNGVLDSGVEGEDVGHPRLVDDHQGAPVDVRRPAGQVMVLKAPGEFGQGVGLDPGVFGQDGGGGSGGGEADDLTAVLGPGQGEGSHRGRLAGAGRRDRQLDPGIGGAHLADEGCLPGIKHRAIRRHFQERQLHGGWVDRRPIVSAGGCEDMLLGVEDPLGGVAVGAGDRVDRRPVGPPQIIGFLDPVGRRFEGDRSVVQDFRDEEVD